MSADATSSNPRLPVLVFDGDCGFCTSCARFVVRRVVGGCPVSVAPWQGLNLADLALTPDRCRQAVQWVGPDGVSASGHAAIAAVLRAGHRPWTSIGVLMMAPGISWLARRTYCVVADHRSALPGGTPACQSDNDSNSRG